MKRKNFYITLILFVYLFGILQPIFPYIDYLINYTFIVENLCEQKDEIENMCMGKCYLNKQLEEKILEMQNKTEKKESDSEINIQMLSFHFDYKTSKEKFDVYKSNDYHSFLITDLICQAHKPNTPPPKFI